MLAVSLWAKNLLEEVVQDTDGGPWTIYGVPSGLRIGTVTASRELGLTTRYPEVPCVKLDRALKPGELQLQVRQLGRRQ